MRTRARAGFTLIELMVAMALTLFIMVIMSQAFVTSLETFSAMKGLAEMTRNLRTAEVLLRDDLMKDHFEGKRRLSDPNNSGTTPYQIVAQPPQAGFFAVRRSTAASLAANAPYCYEGKDGSGVPSYRASDHMIYMTVKRRGNRQENFFTASLQNPTPAILNSFFTAKTAYNVQPADLPSSTWVDQYAGGTSGFYSSQWAEVVYYLVRTGTTSEPNNPGSAIGSPIYSLCRAQFVMVPDSTNVNPPNNSFPNGLDYDTFAGMSCLSPPGNNPVKFFSPADAALSQRVISDLTTLSTGAPAPAVGRTLDYRVFSAATVVCPNVVSFQVQVMPMNGNAFDDPPPSPSALLYDTTKFNPAGVAAGYPQVGLRAIQITLRVWDQTTQQTRQLTVIQDL
jgi:prepilin-type N-terminal cleavage/methylation domain-containing protein